MQFLLPFGRSRRDGSRTQGRAAATGAAPTSIPSPTAFASLAVAAGVAGVVYRRINLNPAVSPQPRKRVVISSPDKSVDLVLSSGFLSFANHSGFLKAVEEAGLKVDGIMGTSAGALSGALYAAGYTPQQIAHELSKNPPSHYLQLSAQPWQGGVLNMSRAIERYRELLPPTFEELPMDFAVGVVTADGQYRVVDSGPLPEAVVASAAIPVLFENVPVPGVGACMDGGMHCRVGLEGWRRRCAAVGKNTRPAIVHLISRSSPFSGKEAVQEHEDVVVVRSPKSGVSLASLGDFEEHFAASFTRASQVLSAHEFRLPA